MGKRKHDIVVWCEYCNRGFTQVVSCTRHERFQCPKRPRIPRLSTFAVDAEPEPAPGPKAKAKQKSKPKAELASQDKDAVAVLTDLQRKSQAKLMAITMMDMFDGRVEFVSSITGCSKHDIKRWYKERDQEVTATTVDEFAQFRSTLANRFMPFIEFMMAHIMSRAGSVPFEKLYIPLGVMIDKVDKITKYLPNDLPASTIGRALEVAKRTAPKAKTEPEPAPAPPPAPVKTSADEQEWHNLIETIYTDSQNSDAPLSRAEIIDSLIQQRSEARDVLKAIRDKLTGEAEPIESHSVS